MKVSLVLLTFNRAEAVAKSLPANLASAGHPVFEIVHVDNGSQKDQRNLLRSIVQASVRIEHAENLGVAKGYNRGMLLSTGSHIVITGCDRIMPENWLKNWVECFEKIHNTGVVSMYTPPIEKHAPRITGLAMETTGIKILPAIPYEARMHSRELLNAVGLFREDFGLYGYEDSEWAFRVDKYARDHGLINYTLDGVYADYSLARTGCDFLMPDGRTYEDFKLQTGYKPETIASLEELRGNGSPFYNPYV